VQLIAGMEKGALIRGVSMETVVEKVNIDFFQWKK
jgi:hypothetical protein